MNKITKIALLGAAIGFATSMPFTKADAHGLYQDAPSAAKVNAETYRVNSPYVKAYGPRSSAHSPSSPEAAEYISSWWDDRTDTAYARDAGGRADEVMRTGFRDGIHHANIGKDGTPFGS